MKADLDKVRLSGCCRCCLVEMSRDEDHGWLRCEERTKLGTTDLIWDEADCVENSI